MKRHRFLETYRNLPIPMKASLWFLICSFMQKGVSVLTTPIFTRLLNTAEYGNYNVFNSWLSIVTIFVTFNLYAGVFTQGLVKYENDKNAYASSLQGLTFILVAVWTCIYAVFRDFWNRFFSLTTIQMLSMLLMIWTTSTFNFWAASQRVEFKYRTLVVVTMCNSLLKPIVGIIFVLNADDKVTARIIGLAIVELFGYSWCFFYQIIKGGKLFLSKYWKHALAFNIPLIPHYLSQTVLNSADRIMIERMVDSEAAGIYSLAYSISLIMTLFNTALLQTINPWIYKKIKSQKTNDISKVAYGSLIVIGVVNILLIAVAPEIVSIFAPVEYRDAIWVIPPVALSVIFVFAYSLFADFEFYYEKTRLIAFATMIGALLNVFLNYVLIPLFGYIAAAYTTLFCYILYALFHYSAMCFVCKHYNKGVNPYSIRKLLLLMCTFLILGVCFMIAYRLSALRYGIIALVILFCICKKNIIVKILLELKNN